MSDHDPCCPSTGMAMPFGYVPVMPCQCGFIATIRADERERIAQAIEAMPGSPNVGTRDAAARIARNGGRLAAQRHRGGHQ